MTTKRIMQPVEIQPPSDQSVPGFAQPGKANPSTILHIKAAEYWLKLGEADQALRELEALPSTSWTCGWAMKTRIAAMGVLKKGRDEAWNDGPGPGVD